ncbi:MULTISPECIES: TspO/MBR family protein [Candidatus Protochlamydia]|uniref:Tryptophan-rich sensory protein n=1 Tax=Protochlamydia amoebophila (strain UWE25) TaxID=264201 RepID=Q6MBY7_PARUW|nr:MULTISPECIES: TspO/MBR family protein [Protochlamydia]CAF23912.1 unnamed protein product [Candidatus Protochlamydia amoebophila UWE25]
MSHILKLVICLLICVGGGWACGWITSSSVHQWYPTLIKSSLTPPNIVFPIVWTFLYVFMAIALYLIWISPTKNKKPAFFIFGVQLICNFLWSWIFFYLQLPFIALLNLMILWGLVLNTINVFYQHSKLASQLLWPYWIWISFAWYLNAFIVFYN